MWVPEDRAPLPGTPSDSISGAIGHVILASGPDENGGAVVIWHLTPTGRPSGAWITAAAEFADSATRIRPLISGRAVLRWDDDPANEVFDQFDSVEVLLADCLVEISEYRAAYAAAIAEHAKTVGARMAPLAWRREVPTVRSWSEFLGVSRIPPPDATSPLATYVLHLARAAAWAAELWQDTETVRTRRRDLVDRFGQPSPLPPVWLARLRTAYEKGV